MAWRPTHQRVHMRRLLASILDTTRGPWRWWSDSHPATPVAQHLIQRSSGLSDPYTLPPSDGATSARLIVPLVIEANRSAVVTPIEDAPPLPLRMRSAPHDRHQTVISGRMSDVCALLDRLVADQSAGLDPVLH